MRKTVLLSALAALAISGAALFAARADQPVAGSAALPASQQATASNAPVVYELFTSQGCSSCPPADALAAMMAQDPGLIVISRPVTYWDRLGWKDSLASPVNTDLQRAYVARGLAGYSGVYTPQVVINGRSGQVGSQEGQLRELIGAAQEAPSPRLSYDPATATVAIDGAAATPATLSLVGVDSGDAVAIGSGENGGREVHYTNVWKGERALGEWRGGAASFTVPAEAQAIAGADRHFVLLREGTSGAILAAARL